MDNIDVSIIIVNWNTCRITCDCLESIYSDSHKLDYEVIVVDNASEDDSVREIEKHYPRVRLIKNKRNRGFAGANNQGLGVAEGEYVLLLNSDTIILDHAIEKTLMFMREHPDTGICGCRVLNPDKTLQPTCFMYPSALNMLISASYINKLFPKSPLFGREQMTWWDRDCVRDVDVVTGCFMLIKAEVIRQVGPMDENFFMFGEETDWCYRFKKAGWRPVFTPVAEIIHLGGGSTRLARPKMILQLRSGILQFMHKHYSQCEYRAGCILVAFFYGLRLPFWLVKAIIGDDRQSSWMILRTYFQGVWRALFGWKALKSKADFA